MKIALNRLQKAYLKGYTTYPRVRNDYIQLEFYAHPKLKNFDKYTYPLKFKKYELTFNTLPLFLENYNLSTPATLQRNFNAIKNYFNFSLTPINEPLLKEKIFKYKKFLNSIEKKYKIYNLFFEDYILKKYTIFNYTIKNKKKLNIQNKYIRLKDTKNNFLNIIDTDNIFDIREIIYNNKINYYLLLQSFNNRSFDDASQNTYNKKNINVSENFIEDNDELAYWKNNTFTIYKKQKLKNFIFKEKNNLTYIFGKNIYKNLFFIKNNNKLFSKNEDSVKSAKAMIEIAINLGWNLNKLKIYGSIEFKKAVENEILNFNRSKKNELRR